MIMNGHHTMSDFILHFGAKFSDEDKRKCFGIIETVIKLANCARMMGVLALEEEIKDCESRFLQVGLELVVDGTDPDIVKTVMQHMIQSGEHTGADLLERLMLAEGVLAIQSGMNPRVIVYTLGAMLGESYVGEAAEAFFGGSDMHSPFNFNSDNMPTQPPQGRITLPECAAFEKRLSKLNARNLSVLINYMDIRTFTIALEGCSSAFLYQIQSTVSERVFAQICNSLKESSTPKAFVLQYQATVIKTLTNLKEAQIVFEADDFK